MSEHLPQWKCHKQVGAFKIAAVSKLPSNPCKHPMGATTCGYEQDDRMHQGSTDPVLPPSGRHQYVPTWPSRSRSDGVAAILIAEENGIEPVRVGHRYLRKHNPQPGGYYVLYQDGYKSYSPAQAFEEGYTRIGGEK